MRGRTVSLLANVYVSEWNW